MATVTHQGKYMTSHLSKPRDPGQTQTYMLTSRIHKYEQNTLSLCGKHTHTHTHTHNWVTQALFWNRHTLAIGDNCSYLQVWKDNKSSRFSSFSLCSLWFKHRQAAKKQIRAADEKKITACHTTWDSLTMHWSNTASLSLLIHVPKPYSASLPSSDLLPVSIFLSFFISHPTAPPPSLCHPPTGQSAAGSSSPLLHRWREWTKLRKDTVR